MTGQYLSLDVDHNGMLSKGELIRSACVCYFNDQFCTCIYRFGTGTLTSVFIDRIFQECLTYEGEVVSPSPRGHAFFITLVRITKPIWILCWLWSIKENHSPYNISLSYWTLMVKVTSTLLLSIISFGWVVAIFSSLVITGFVLQAIQDLVKAQGYESVKIEDIKVIVLL